MKRNYLIALTLSGVLLLCALVQLSAELTLEQAVEALGEKERALQNANTHLIPPHTEMWAKYVEWTQNEEEVNRDNLIATSTVRDPAALVSLGIMHAADISDKLRLSRELAGKISTFNTKQKAVTDAAKALQTAWNNYIPLAQHLSPEERYNIVTTPLTPSPPPASLTCPACSVRYSGVNLGGIGDHITLCSVNGHTVSPYPYFSCESSGCPLSNEHHTFPCRGGCGKMFRQPTILSPPPSSQGAGNLTKIYYDDGYPCDVDVPGFGNCPNTAYKCQTPPCKNDANHLKKAPCGEHTVLASEFPQHEALPNGHARKGRCTYTHNFDGTWYQCIVMITHKCDLGHGSGLANQHDFNPNPSLVYPIISPDPEPIPPPDNSVTCSECGVSYDPGSSSANDHSLQASCSSTDGNGNSCTVTSFYACDGHSHSYPTPTVSCWRSSCTASVSSAYEHQVPPCSACGSSYWTCGTYASYSENQHRERTCRRSGCGNTWRRCQGATPRCSVQPGQGCWAQ